MTWKTHVEGGAAPSPLVVEGWGGGCQRAHMSRGLPPSLTLPHNGGGNNCGSAAGSLARRALLLGFAALFAGPAAARASADILSFAELYKNFGVRGYEFADRVRALGGHEVAMQG